MNQFICAASTNADVPAADVLRAHLGGRARALRLRRNVLATASGRFAWSVENAEAVSQVAASLKGAVVLGPVRLTNAKDLMRIAAIDLRPASDQQLLLLVYAVLGDRLFTECEGEFAFAFWDEKETALHCVRDTFGVRRIYHRDVADATLATTCLDILQCSEDVNENYVAEFLTGRSCCEVGETIWRDCRSVSPNSAIRVAAGRREVRTLWRGPTCRDLGSDERGAVEEFRRRLIASVLAHLSTPERTWAELSGGIDSSSIVSIARRFGGTSGGALGIEGSYTITDENPGANESRFVDEIVREYPHETRKIPTIHAWADDGEDPPRTDEPRLYYPFWARDRAANAAMRLAGAERILSGGGADFFLTGNDDYIADLLAAGAMREGMTEILRMAAARHVSFREVFQEQSKLLLPGPARSRTQRAPAWLTRKLSERALSVTSATSTEHPKNRYPRFGRRIDAALRGLPGHLELPFDSSSVEKSYPFLDRALVGLALRLEPRMLRRPTATKWILREAMRGVLPEPVRVRAGKGFIDTLICWSMNREANVLYRMLAKSLCAEAGWIAPDCVRASLDAAMRGFLPSLVDLLRVLALETWLQVRTGRWTRERRLG